MKENQKQCLNCLETKSKLEFSKNKNRKDGLDAYCRSCRSQFNRDWYSKPENRRLVQSRVNQYYRDHVDECKEYRTSNKAKISERMCRWRKNNKRHITDYKRKYNRDVQSKDINYRLLHNLRTRLQIAVKTGKKSAKTMDLVGCDVPALKLHLESKFTPGMDWSNYGRKGWHVDHIQPCSSFDLSTGDGQRECFHYTNLQPLWWIDNCVKGTSIIGRSSNS